MLAAGVISGATTLPAQTVKFDEDGEIVIGSQRLEFVFFDPSWRATRLAAGFRDAEKTVEPTMLSQSGEFTPRSIVTPPFQLKIQATIDSPNRANLQLIAEKLTEPISSNAFGLNLEVPISPEVQLRLDGRLIDFEGEPPPWFSNVRRFSVIELADRNGTLRLEGTLNCIFQDGRKHKRDGAQLRILASPDKGTFDRSELEIQGTYEPHRYDLVDLSEVANRTLVYESAGAGTGGWTDQGPDRDMRLLPTGDAMWKTVPYQIAEDGNQVLVLRGQGATENPEALEVEVDSEQVRSLFLVHASAWTPRSEEVIGRVVLVDADGESHTRDVVATRDVGDWVTPFRLPNAEVPWSDSDDRSPLGIYMTHYEFPDVEARQIRFESTGKGQWLILAATTSPDSAPLPRAPQDEGLVMAADDEWREYALALEVAEGSALDFSWLAEAPAGKHGAVIIKDGQMFFQDRPDEPVRFFGTNLINRAAYPTKETADLLAQRLRRLGYNTVRLHHVDRQLWEPDSRTATAESLDRFLYLCAALKKNGLYLSIDIYASRRINQDVLSVLGKDIRDKNWFKALVGVSPEAMELWKEQADELLFTPNPYTGIPLGHDPALMSICLVNEDAIVEMWDRSPEVAQLYREKFEKWLEATGQANASVEQRQELMTRFLVESQTEQYRAMSAYLREKGVTAPLSGLNWGDNLPTMWTRTTLDYVDNHSYWNHPRYPQGIGNMPYSYQNESVLTADGKTPRELFPTRVFGLPFFVTEFNYCYPNPSRGEGGAVMGAYAAFQDWTGIYRFSYSGQETRVLNVAAPGPFDTVTEPILQFSDRIIALLFLRGDVTPAKSTIAYQLPESPTGDIPARFPIPFSRLGLVTGLGSLAPGSDFKADVVVDTLPTDDATALGIFDKLPDSFRGAFDPKDGEYVSETGEIRMSRQRQEFSVATPRSEVLVLPAEGKLDANRASARNASANPATVAVLSLDGEDLTTSQRMLLLHLTDADATGADYANQDRTVLQAWGRPPHLVRAGVVDLQLKGMTGTGKYTLYALNPDGSRADEVPITRNDDVLDLRLDVHATGQPVLAYELVMVADEAGSADE